MGRGRTLPLATLLLVILWEQPLRAADLAADLRFVPVTVVLLPFNRDATFATAAYPQPWIGLRPCDD